MMPDQKLTEIFSKFAGREVAVREEPYKLELKNLGTFEGIECHFEDNNPVLRELEAEAKNQGLTLRTFLPGWAGDCMFDDKRLNVNVAKDTDGKYRIGNQFSLG